MAYEPMAVNGGLAAVIYLVLGGQILRGVDRGQRRTVNICVHGRPVAGAVMRRLARKSPGRVRGRRRDAVAVAVAVAGDGDLLSPMLDPRGIVLGDRTLWRTGGCRRPQRRGTIPDRPHQVAIKRRPPAPIIRDTVHM